MLTTPTPTPMPIAAPVLRPPFPPVSLLAAAVVGDGSEVEVDVVVGDVVGVDEDEEVAVEDDAVEDTWARTEV